jgi:5-methylcytosine-specific restriction endonuclease McrA
MKASLQEKARMDARVAREVAEFEASRAWLSVGACSASAWMRHEGHLSGTEAGRLVHWGRALSHLPLIERAFAEGAITGAHVALLVALDQGATHEPLCRQQQLVVDLACNHTFAEFKHLLGYWHRCADPDGTTEAAEQRRNRRDAYLVRGLDGTWVGRMNLDDVSGTIVADELARLEQLLFDADRIEATARLGRTPLTSELLRTPAQRRADAHVWMARRSASRTEGGAKPAPLFNVHVGWETLQGALAELEDGTPVCAQELLSWLEGADIVRIRHDPEGPMTLSHATRLSEVTMRCVERAVFDGPDRKECPSTDRIFTGATRRAIEIRDRHCTHPYCDRPARYCQIDHIKPYTQGGLTTQDNGRLLCGFHNRWYYHHQQRFGPDKDSGPDPEQRPPARE